MDFWDTAAYYGMLLWIALTLVLIAVVLYVFARILIKSNNFSDDKLENYSSCIRKFNANDISRH